MEYSISFAITSALGKTVRKWWEAVNDEDQSEDKRLILVSRGERAELRRAADITAVTLTPAFQRFFRLLVKHGFPEQSAPWQQDRLAVIAGILAHVRGAVDKRMPEAMKGDDGPRVSELRFRRLLESPSMDELYIGLRRVLPLIEKKADPNRLAEDIWHWGNRVKKEWAYAYPWPEKAG